MKFEENWPKGYRYRGEVAQRCGRTTEDRQADNGRTTTDDRRQVITTAHPEPGSGELARGPWATARSSE